MGVPRVSRNRSLAAPKLRLLDRVRDACSSARALRVKDVDSERNQISGPKSRTVRRQGAASDLTRQFHIVRTCSEPRNDATCRSFARIWLLPCEALTPAMLQLALRHCFWIVPSN